MIKLRWAVRIVDTKPVQVLQYSQEIDVTIRAQLPGQTWKQPYETELQWSPWMDVPVVFEEKYN